jgi:hypothetical protein
MSLGPSRSANGVDDLRVRRAAADVAAHPFPNFAVSFGVPLLDARYGAHNLSRRAEAALKGVVLNECRLHWVEAAIWQGKTLRSGNLAPFTLRDKDKARINWSVVQMNRASSAFAAIASLFCPSEIQVLA